MGLWVCRQTFLLTSPASCPLVHRIRISFNVQREIVTGLKYVHAVKKMGVRVENETYMVGSYGPKLEMHEYTTPFDEMPKGMVYRG